MEGISETLWVELQDDGQVKFIFGRKGKPTATIVAPLTMEECQNAADIFEMFSHDLMHKGKA